MTIAMRSTSLFAAALMALAGLLTPPAAARNADLSTVPPRAGVQLTIYNSEDLTLVRETRTMSFRNGVNPLQFSWAGTLIDPSSVELRFLTHADKLELLDTTFPHDKPQMLYWNIRSELDGEARVEITYFTSGVTWSAETAMSFEGFVRVVNNSGEDYDDVQVRLVVGTINLVEKIAELARVPMNQVRQLGEQLQVEFRSHAMKAAVQLFDKAEAATAAGGPVDEKQIIKQGLSEYFIYTIEGTETIPNGWSRRMRSFDGRSVPLRIEYRYRPAEYGEQLVRMYLLANDKPSGLGTTPLPDGAVRVFRDNGRDGLSYLATQSVRYIPIGDRIELNLGPDPEVIFELIKLRAARDNIWMHLDGTDIYRRVDDGRLKIDVRSTVAGWNDHEVFAQRIRNYTGRPIHVEIRRSYPGDVTFRSTLSARRFDFQTVEFAADVPPAQRADLLHEIVRRQGYNAKQNNVTIEEAEVKG
jgi:hypothetical protein